MDQISQVREKIDIVALISSHIPLKRAGRNFKATCPFHSEKTPSFVVSPERQIWHCFGCQKGGDAFSFLMEFEHMDFAEALRVLAKEAGIELKYSQRDIAMSSKKEKIYLLNRLARDFYHYILTNHNAGKKGLAYLVEKRNIPHSLIKTFTLGFAPGGGSALSAYLLKKKGYAKEDLLEAGLCVKRGNTLADFFVGRIIFPLVDHRENIIGFSGRVLTDGENEQGPKYINTRDTLVYHKGSSFFGIHTAKDTMKKTGKVILTEGEFDVISAFAHGIRNIVAVKGTAVTESQVGILARYVSAVCLCFDQDIAGYEAMKKALQALESKGLTVTVAIPVEGKDIDESARKNRNSLKKTLEQEVSVYDFFFSRALSLHNKETAEGKKRIGEELLPLFSFISNEIVKEHYVRKLSSAIDTSYESIIREMDRIRKREVVRSKQTESVSMKRSREEVLQEYLIALTVQNDNPKALIEMLERENFLSVFSTPAYQKLIERLRDLLCKQQAFSAKQFSRSLPQELVAIFDTCFLLPKPEFGSVEHLLREGMKVAKELQFLAIQMRMKRLSEVIKDKAREGKNNEIVALEKELSSLAASVSPLMVK